MLCGKTLDIWVETKQPEPELAPQKEPLISPVIKPPRELTPEEHIRIGELIYSAYKHKEAGAIEDAILACQGALALNESSAPAHALLGSLYECKGDIPSAIYQYEKVMVLDPGNVAHRQKLESLQRTPVATGAQPSDSSAKWKFPINLDRFIKYVPIIVPSVVFIVVFLILILTVGKNQNKTVQEGDQFVPPKTNIPQTTTPVQPGSQSFYPQGQPGQLNPQPYLGPGQVQSPQGPNKGAAQGRANQAEPERTGPVQIPVPKSGVVTGERPATPLPAFNPQPVSRPAPAPPVMTPVIEPRSTAHFDNPPAPAPKPRPAPQPAPQAADPEERAIQYQGSGKYQEAIGAYRDALSRTSDSGRIYQQMAICYNRMNQRDQAVSSYKSAIRSYRDQLAAGRDPSEVQRNIRSCEAGIEAVAPSH